MKKLAFSSLFVFALAATCFAQPKAELLPDPPGWQLEQFKLPPVFAPALPYHGIEELRFSPDMFKKDAPNYFTYAFAARLDSTTRISAAGIKDYLLVYFRGLCGKTAADRKLPPVDTAAILVSIEGQKITSTGAVYMIKTHAFGVFQDGAPVDLNMEAKVVRDVPGKKVYVLFIVSPQPKTAAIWQELYQVQKNFAPPPDTDAGKAILQ